MILVLVSLLLWAVAALNLNAHLDATTDDSYDLLHRIDEDDSVVAVVRRNKVLYLLYDETIIGAEFDNPNLRKQAAYPGFAIMQCAAYLTRKPTRALQIGLGIGTVPSFLRDMAIPTDVVEISEAVVTQAADYFQYEWCTVDEDEDERCVNGQTYVMDGLVFLASEPADLGISTELHPYELVVVDVYTGWNPLAFFVRETMLLVRNHWLTRDGVVVMNFVGYMHGPRAVVPQSIYRTLQSVFHYVKCFREMDDPKHTEAANIVFYASDQPLDFRLPATGNFKNPPANSYYSVVTNFPNWQIFTDLSAEVEEIALYQEGNDHDLRVHPQHPRDSSKAIVLTRAAHGQEAFRAIHDETEKHMRERVFDQFPRTLWNELNVFQSINDPSA